MKVKGKSEDKEKISPQIFCNIPGLNQTLPDESLALCCISATRL